jgi:TonB-linked SusC/RagA family outer membrane protein
MNHYYNSTKQCGMNTHKISGNILCGLAVMFSTLSFAAHGQTSDINADTAIHIRRVTVAFGNQTEDQVTGSISTVNGMYLRKTHTSTLTNTFFGRVPGLANLHAAGAPGYDEASTFIRGRHTLQDNGFLVLLDGFQIDGFNQVSPEEIESVQVLKDAAALALYGVKGANGAILITTKRGAPSDKLNITLNARYGYQTPVQLPEFAGSYDYARLYNEALTSDGLQPLYTEQQLNGYREGTDPYLYPDVNWYDVVLRKGSPIQDYSLTFSGGTEMARYFVMAGYMESQGLYDNTDQKRNSNINFQRINFRANVDLTLTKRLSVQAGLGGCIEDRKFPPIPTQDLWLNMATYAPNLYPVRAPSGAITGTANFPNNPLGFILEKGYQSRHNRNVQATVRINEKLDFITQGLNIFGTVSFSSVFLNAYDKTRNYAYSEPIRTTSSTGQDSVYYLVRGTDTDLAVNTNSNSENSRTNFQWGFDYSRDFGRHSVGALVMYHQDVFDVLANQSPSAFQNVMGRLTYGLSGKYFAEFGFSYGGTDNYRKGNRFGFFPALSAAWLIHKEDFWKENEWVRYLKLRASAGLLGNDRGAGRFAYNQYWGKATSQGYYLGTGTSFIDALIQSGMANPNITWEKALLYNIGIETRLLNEKLTLTADAFYEDRYHILVNMGNVIPSLSGVSSAAMENRGEVRNHGIEVQTVFSDKAGSVSYFVGGQFSFARNKVKKSYETPKKESYSSRNGQPVAQYFGLEAIGFFKDESDIISSPVQTFSVVQPGDLKYKDQNGDNIIDINDEIAIGRHSYPEISYGLTAGVAYKGFDLEVLFQGTSNQSVYLDGYMFWPFVNNANISSWAAEGHWTPSTHADATFPRLTTQPNANNYRASTFWVRNVNVLRLRNVELGYTLPAKSLERFRIQNMRIFVSGLNLIRWDDLVVDVDPETLSEGYPVMKTYSAGLRLNF